MKRSTLSLLLTGIILLVGVGLIWVLVVAPRLRPVAYIPTPTPVPNPVPTPAPEERHDALNLYLAAPDPLPAGAERLELTMIKATLVGTDGADVPVFAGVQTVMLQPGVIEKVLSELIPSGRWRRLKLEFSPSAVASMQDGTVTAVLLEKRTAALAFDAELPISKTLAIFARLPVASAFAAAGKTATLDLPTDPATAETYVFGSFMLDKRGTGDLWNVPSPSIAGAVKADLGFDISVTLKGSGGFVAPEQGTSAPVAP